MYNSSRESKFNQKKNLIKDSLRKSSKKKNTLSNDDANRNALKKSYSDSFYNSKEKLIERGKDEGFGKCSKCVACKLKDQLINELESKANLKIII
jgi:CO dehydrogenase nickel-insertion accessory protein CooC1